MNFKEFESAEKLRGGYYTDPAIANYLSGWVCEIKPSSILEPGCGDGVFLETALSCNGTSLKKLIGCEIIPSEARKARNRVKKPGDAKIKVHNQNFLEWGFELFKRGMMFDGVIGNPPFIRYQYLEDADQEQMEEIFNHFALKFTKHTNVWVPFVLLSLALLRPGGRMAMVIPSEILHVLHAQSLRSFLAENCSKVLIIDPEELWFSNTLQGVILIMAEKKKKSSEPSRGVSIISVSDRSVLQRAAEKLFRQAEYLNGEVIKGKWMLALLNKKERDLLKEVSSHGFIKRLGDIAEVDVGIVTGANAFFLVPDSTVKKYGLSEWAHLMFGRSEHVKGVIYDEKNHLENQKRGLPTNFLWFGPDELNNFPNSVQAYIKEGEKLELHKRYKCRIRTPWYNVPSVYVTSVGMLKRAHQYPRLILNKAAAYTTDTAYRIKPIKIKPEQLVYNFVNSLTALSSEIEGRHYGGGVLELVPSEIEKVMIPITKEHSFKSLRELDGDHRSKLPAEVILENQDNIVLRDFGLTKMERQLLLNAWLRLRSRRQRKSKVA